MSEAKIELRNVSKRFGKKVVLDGINLTVPKGESLVVIGGSGTGKSVMIKCVLGIIRPDSGQIFVDGKNVLKMDASEREKVLRKFGMLFQGAALFDSLPVWENVAFGLIQGRKMKRKQAKDIAIEKLAKVGLGPEVGELYPAELSGGMQKRVGLARAIAADPEIIFFDEPTTGLDPIKADLITDLILKLQHNLKITSIVVTHDMVAAYKVSNRVAMLYDGKIVEIGSPDEIKNTRNEIVRQFIEGHTEEKV